MPPSRPTARRWASACRRCSTVRSRALDPRSLGDDLQHGCAGPATASPSCRYGPTRHRQRRHLPARHDDRSSRFADDGDFLLNGRDDPVILRRKAPVRRLQLLPLEITNRANEYNTEPAGWDDQGLIDQLRAEPAAIEHFRRTRSASPRSAVVCAQLYGQRAAYVRNQFEFTSGRRSWPRCGSKGTITIPVRHAFTSASIEIEETGRGQFHGCSSRNGTARQFGRAGTRHAGRDQHPVNTNVSARRSIRRSSSSRRRRSPARAPKSGWPSAAGPSGAFDPNWGGCFVWLSSTTSPISKSAQIDTAARMGVLATALASYGGANPDTTHSFAVDPRESDGELVGVTAADAAAFVTSA
jgi:hypothetical protein